MKLNAISEGSVTAARGDIVTTVNDIAAKIARSAQTIFGGNRQLQAAINFQKPQLETTDEEDRPAIVLLRIGGRTPETISITVFGDGDGEVKLEMSERLAKLLGLPHYDTASSLGDVDNKLGAVAAIIGDKLGISDVKNVKDNYQPGQPQRR